MLSRFWSEYFWLPANTTWEDISNGPDQSVVYAEAKDYLFQIPLVILSLTLRFLSENYIFRPLGRYLRIKDFKAKAPANPKLEAAYLKSSTIKNVEDLGLWAWLITAAPKMFQAVRASHFTLTFWIGCKIDALPQASALAKQLDLTERQVERWWRLRRRQDKPSTLVKFCENMWRGFHYTLNASLGLYVVWGQEWLRDVDMTFDGYPHQGISPDMWWFYMIASSFYLSLIVTQFHDVRRKDFWQMFIHHIATIGLLFFSWVCQCYRIGCLILILHDMGDIILEFGKAAKYASYQRTVDCLFGVFFCVWVVTRLVLIPFYVLPTAFSKLTCSPMIFIMNILLLLLFVLSLLWTWLILQILWKTINAGQFDNDVRSSDSEESDASYSNGVTQGRNAHITPAQS